MRYGWMIAICLGWLLSGCQSEKEEAAQAKAPVSEQQPVAASPAPAEAPAKPVEMVDAGKSAATGVVIAAADSVADMVKGQAKAAKCKACHSLAAGEAHRTGPNLFAVSGRPAGTAAGFNFSSGLKNAGFTWDAAKLAVWVCDSKAAIKELTGNANANTSMPKQRVCGADAANLAAYLDSLQ